MAVEGAPREQPTIEVSRLRGEDLGFQQLSTLRLPPEPNWVVKGMLAPGNLSGLYGLFKSGKTTIFLAMIATAQRGEPFLGLQTRDPGPVLMLIEDNLSSFQAYAKRLGVKLDGVHVISRRHLRKQVAGFGWPEIADAVGQQAAALGSQVVYCDLNPWAKLEPEAENDAGAVQLAVDPLLTLTGDQGLAVWVSLQANKGGGIRGSTAWGANLDVILGLAKPRNDDDDHQHLPRTTRLLDGIGRWEAIPESLVIELVDRQRYELRGTSTRQATASTEDQVVLARAESNGPVTRDVIREVLGCGQSKAKGVIARLVERGRLEQVEGSGTGRRKAEWRFVKEVEERW